MTAFIDISISMLLSVNIKEMIANLVSSCDVQKYVDNNMQYVERNQIVH